MGYKIRKFDGSFNETNNMDGVFDESRNTLNGRGDNDISRFSLNGRGDNDISPYSLGATGDAIPVAETTYSTTTLAGVGAAAMVAGLAAGWFLFKKK